MVRALLHGGSHVRHTDRSGRTAEQLAEGQGRRGKQVLKLLRLCSRRMDDLNLMRRRQLERELQAQNDTLRDTLALLSAARLEHKALQSRLQAWTSLVSSCLCARLLGERAKQQHVARLRRLVQGVQRKHSDYFQQVTLTGFSMESSWLEAPTLAIRSFKQNNFEDQGFENHHVSPKIWLGACGLDSS